MSRTDEIVTQYRRHLHLMSHMFNYSSLLGPDLFLLRAIAPKTKALQGQALPEYCLYLSLVAIVAIAGLSPLGQGLFNHFSNMGGQTTSVNASLNAMSGSSGTSQAAGASTGGSVPASSGTSTAATGTGTVTGSPLTAPAASTGTYQSVTATLKNGTTLNLGKYPSNAAQLVETAGVSGTTQYMVGMLQTMAQQLKDSGSITEAQYSSLINLSNKGHDIGTVQGQLEGLMNQNGGTLVGLLDNEMPIMGKESYADGWFKYTVSSNAKALGSNSTGPYGSNVDIDWLTSFDTNNKTNPNAWANPLFNNFSNAYNAAKADGSLSDPVVKQIVDDLAFKIMISGEVFEEDPKSTIVSEVKSVFTHYNSKGICNQGNGNDSGVQCSPS